MTHVGRFCLQGLPSRVSIGGDWLAPTMHCANVGSGPVGWECEFADAGAAARLLNAATVSNVPGADADPGPRQCRQWPTSERSVFTIGWPVTGCSRPLNV